MKSKTASLIAFTTAASIFFTPNALAQNRPPIYTQYGEFTTQDTIPENVLSKEEKTSLEEIDKYLDYQNSSFDYSKAKNNPSIDSHTLNDFM
ncbi:hypothetical protein [Corynebacterium kutscheri]|uniref:Uncharacterized protein n=1 Tax=Corynebacterium kutscheri TaxID=35755 RepID=A0AB38VV48_9CORY|nr:hypothetical protein [Corynebacterium kutscheri]VEH05335.1 Uncharacterised protein [Corynebacterium kutscheri]